MKIKNILGLIIITLLNIILQCYVFGLESKFNWTITYYIDSNPSQIVEIVPRLEFKKGMNHTSYEILPRMYGKWECTYSLIQSDYEDRKYIKENLSLECSYGLSGPMILHSNECYFNKENNKMFFSEHDLDNSQNKTLEKRLGLIDQDSDNRKSNWLFIKCEEK